MSQFKSGGWEGKKMNALGDSLTHGDITGTGVDGTPWTDYIPALTGLAVCRNYGINGNRLAGPGGMAERLTQMAPEADLISVFGGMNDFCCGVPLGSFGDRGTETFYGSLHTLTEGLYARYPDAEIFFLTPPKCRSTLYDWESFKPNAAGLILKDYRDAILRVADLHSIPVLDLYTNCGMSCYLDNGKYRPDGLHFSILGYRRLAGLIAAFIRQL